MSASAAVPTPTSLAGHVRETVALAGPVMVARLGIVGLTIIDILVLGRAGEVALADYILGQSLYDGLTGMVYGLLLGVPVLAARAIGADRPEEAGAIWRRGLLYGALIGVLVAVLLQGAEAFLLAIGQDPTIAERSGQVARLLGVAMAPLALYIVSALFLEALGRPLPGMIAILIANVTNLFLNIVLVFGHFGLPAMGAVGTAVATIINLSGLALGLGLYVRYGLKDRARFGLVAREHSGWRAGGEQRRLGYAAGISYGLEAGSFTALTLVIGFLGVTALATHAVLFQVIGLTFMVAFGFATATQVRVSQAWGRGSGGDIVRAGWVGLGLATAANAGLVALCLVFPAVVVGLFTAEPAIQAAAVPVMIWVALLVLLDGGQSVMNLACRGRGDTWVPTAIHFSAYWLIMVPGGAALALWAGHGLAGIYQGIAAASLISAGGLALRFAWLTRGHGARRGG